MHVTTARRAALLFCHVLASATPAIAQAPDLTRSQADLKRLSIEQLMNIEVTSASRREEALGGAAAALTVVTNEDIRRTGVTSIPEALRLLPGIHVARQTSNSWAVSSRGFTSINSEKLLVLTDTRSLYTPLFSGVFWDVQNYLLQDVERIEVIRGPGATLWGSNAVNGVINITTKHARDTQGLYVSTAAGTEDQAVLAARYGGSLGDQGHYRVFAGYTDRGGTRPRSAGSSADGWQTGHAGFRADWDRGAADSFTVQGDLYRGDIGQLSPAIVVSGRTGPAPPLRVSTGGGNVLARWRRRTSTDADLQLRVYYDRTHRNDPSFLDDLDTVDVDLLRRLTPASAHEVTWGLNYRFTSNRNHGKGIFAVEPAASRDSVISGFVQDEISVADGVRLTAGTKLEHNEFSGFEAQPSGRLVWDASPTQTVWGAVSRAVRVPTRLERDLAVDLADPAANPIPRLLGSDTFESEELLATEAGYRWQPVPALFIDLAAFHNRYSGLASLEIGDPFTDRDDGRTVVPVSYQNLTDGRASGAEALVTLTPVPWWRLTTSSSFLDLSVEPAGQDLNHGAFFEGSTPRHQLALRSYLDLPAAFQVDTMFRHQTAIRQLPFAGAGEGIAAYAELDLRFAWRGWRDLELSLAGQNLLHDSHPEFGGPLSRGEIERGVYLRAAWGF